MRLCVILFAFIAQSVYAQTYTLYVGESTYLYTPSVPGTLGNAAWTCDKNNDVYVNGNKNGATVIVNQYFSGTATITCTYVYSYYIGTTRYYSDSMHAYYYITCRPSTVSLNKREVTLKPGQEVELTYTNSSGYKVNPYWTTSDRKVASIDGYEKLSAESVTIVANQVGECIITCYGRTGYTDPTCRVIVKADPPISISVKPEKLTLQEGKKSSFTYELKPSDAYTRVTWSSDNESVAKVSSGGQVTAVTQGKAKITATTDNGLSASGIVEVTPLPLSVSLPNRQQTTIGYAFKLEPILTPSNATTTYKWMSDNPGIAVVDKSGRVKGKNAGTAKVTVTTENGKTASCSISVKKASEGMDYRNAEVRTGALKKLISNSLSRTK